MSYITISDILNEELKNKLIIRLQDLVKKYQNDKVRLEMEILMTNNVIKIKRDKYKYLQQFYDENLGTKTIERKVDVIKEKIKMINLEIESELEVKKKFIENEKSDIEAELLSDIREINVDTSLFDERIELLKEKIQQLQNEIDFIEQQKKEVNEIMDDQNTFISQEKYILNERNKLTILTNEIFSLNKKITNGKRVLRELELSNDYLNYSKNLLEDHDDNITNNISLRSLVSKCNEHHQTFLLEKSNNGKGWHTDEITEECEDNCNGWYYNNDRCECGNYGGWFWLDEDCDIGDVNEFTIHSTMPIGTLSSYD